MTLCDMTDKQLVRLYHRVCERLRDGMGYQPYGMDWPTMFAVKPACAAAYRAVENEVRRRQGVWNAAS